MSVVWIRGFDLAKFLIMYLIRFFLCWKNKIQDVNVSWRSNAGSPELLTS